MGPEINVVSLNQYLFLNEMEQKKKKMPESPQYFSYVYTGSWYEMYFQV